MMVDAPSYSSDDDDEDDHIPKRKNKPSGTKSDKKKDLYKKFLQRLDE